MTAHDQLGRKVVGAVLKKFKDGEWECNGGSGKDFVRTSTSKKHPSPDHAFMDSATKLKLTFEYKPQTESKRGILTGLGQAVAYLEQSDISFLVIPKKLDDGYDIEAQMTEIIANQIVGNPQLGAAYWQWTAGICGIAIALTGPFLGSIADKKPKGKINFLQIFTLLCILTTCLYWFAKPNPNYI